MNNNNFSSIIKTELKDTAQDIPTKHRIACKNCARLHHKCDKIFPSCSHCLKKGVKCEVNPSVKKRGRPFGTTKENIEKKKQIKSKREHECIQSPIITDTPVKKLKIPQKEIKSENKQVIQDLFYQVPIDINWEFSFQDNINNVQPIIQTTSQNDFLFPSEFSVYSSDDTESDSDCQNFLTIDNLDFDHFNSFVEEYQF